MTKKNEKKLLVARVIVFDRSENPDSDPVTFRLKFYILISGQRRRMEIKNGWRRTVTDDDASDEEDGENGEEED